MGSDVIIGIIVVIVGIAAFIFNRHQSSSMAAQAAVNDAATQAQHAADLAVWANSIYNPASPSADHAAIANAMSRWFGAHDAAFDPANRNSVNFNPTL